MNGLTAWERWELASLDAEEAAEKPAADPAQTVSAEELESIRQQAREEGRQEGHTAGHAAGYADGQAAARAEAERLARAAGGIERAMAELDQQVADELLALAMAIARQVIRTEIAVRPESILRVVHDALAQLPHQHATIYLHPDDASLVRSYAGDTLSHAGHRIVEDPALKPGDCLLEAGSSQLDGSLETRWRRTIESMGLDSTWAAPDKP